MNRNHKVTRKVASKVYLCDIEKNRHCKGLMGERCQKECFCTMNTAYAVDPTHPLTNEELKAEWDKRHPEVEVGLDLSKVKDQTVVKNVVIHKIAESVKESEEEDGSNTIEGASIEGSQEDS